MHDRYQRYRKRKIIVKKLLTFKEFLKQERNRENILKGASGLDEVLESATVIKDISLSNSALREIEERDKKLESMLDDFSFSNLKKAIGQIKIDTSAIEVKVKPITTDTSAKIGSGFKSVKASAKIGSGFKPVKASAKIGSGIKTVEASVDRSAFESTAKSLFNTISPISKIYSSELEKIKSTIDISVPTNIINSEAFIEAKKIQNELIKFEPDIDILPITTLEKSIESNDPNAFEKAAEDVNSIKKAELNRVINRDLQMLDTNPAKNRPIDFLIVVGLPEELNTFRNFFNVASYWESDVFSSTTYFFGEIESKTKIYSVALVYGEDMGNFYALQVTNAAIDDLQPKVVISAGMGYTLNPYKLGLCDLHITNEIMYWGLTSKEYESTDRKEATKVRSIPVRVRSNHLYQESRKYEKGIRIGKTSFETWKELVKRKLPPKSEIMDANINAFLKEIDGVIHCGIPKKIFNESPKVVVGKTMVSDDAVIASIDAIRRRSLFDAGNESNISGEMEAAGVAMAVANRKSSIEFIAIRGICDFGFGKNVLEDLSTEFRLIAAYRVATFIRSFLESDLTLPKSDVGTATELGIKRR